MRTSNNLTSNISDQISALARNIGQTDTFDKAIDIVIAVRDLLNMEHAAFTADISGKQKISNLEKNLLVKFGWNAQHIEDWVKNHKDNITYLRCRFESKPFAVVYADVDTNTLSSQQKRIVKLIQKTGTRKSIVAPLHLPYSRIARLSWSSSDTSLDCHALVAQYSAELSAIGYGFAWQYFQHATQNENTPREMTSLSVRQTECLRFCAMGLSCQETSRLLNVAPSTVRYHINEVIKKLGAVNSTHAVALAMQLGMIDHIS